MATAQTTLTIPSASRSARAVLPVAFFAVALVVLSSFIPLLWIHVQQLWIRPHYQFFPFVLAGAAVLAWLRFPGRESLRPGVRALGYGLLAWSALLLAGAELLNSSWLSAVAFLFLILAIVYALGGATLCWHFLPAWIFMWLIVPPPFGWDRSLVLALQALTTRCSSAILDSLGVYHVVAGNVVELGGRRLFVAEACTGINSLFSILACTLFYIFWSRLPLLRSALLCIASLFWVVLANICRVVLVAYLAKRWGVDVAEGWRHDALGFLLFSCALGLIWSTDRLLMFLTPIRRKPGFDVAAPDLVSDHTGTTTPLVEAIRQSWLNSWGVAGIFGALLIFHVGFYGPPQLVAAEAICATPTVSEETMPKDLAGWRLEKGEEASRNPGSAYGEFSKTWAYRGESVMAVFSVDYPFQDYHDLTECYAVQGWEITDRADCIGQAPSEPAIYREFHLKKAGLRTGYVFFCEFDQTGRVAPPGRQQSALRQIMNLVEQKAPTTQARQVGALYQFQLFLESSTPLNLPELNKTKDRFLKGFRTIHSQMFAGADVQQP